MLTKLVKQKTTKHFLSAEKLWFQYSNSIPTFLESKVRLQEGFQNYGISRDQFKFQKFGRFYKKPKFRNRVEFGHADILFERPIN